MKLLKVKQISTLIGSSLLHFIIGSINTFGNLNTYMTSYLRHNGSNGANYGQSVWFTAVGVTAFTFTTIFSGFIAKRFGTRIMSLIATIILCGSIALTSIALKYSFIAVLMSFGLMQNIGSGLMYSTIIVNCIKWFPNYKGLVAGIITGANAFSSFVFIQFQTFYLNPKNLKPNSDGYFDVKEMLEHVPNLFIILSLIYGTIGLIGICLVFNFNETQNNNTIQSDLSGSQSNLIPNCDNEPNLRPITSLTFESNYSVREAVKTRHFFIFWLTFAFSTQTVFFMNAMIKAFGQSYISDDHYLAAILSFSFIVNGIGGVFWGKFLDRFKFRDTIILINAILSVSTFSLIISSYFYKKLLFAIWDFLIYFTTVGLFSCYLPEVVRKFGNKNAITIYGLIHTGPAFIAIILSPIFQMTLNTIGWFGTFCIIASLNMFSMAIIMVAYLYQR